LELYLIRHAWAEERDADRFPDDTLRPLTEAGSMRFEQMCGLLVDRAMKPRRIVSSPLVRCRQTAEMVAAALPHQASIVLREELMPGGDFKMLLAWLEEHCPAKSSVACVGHAPDLGYLAASLIGQENGWLRLGKGSVAAIRFKGAPEFGAGELLWLVSAKILGV
jgi:phosphohistidine phosphatase